MGERDADDVRDENHEATGFFPANGQIPPAPFPLLLQGPLPVMPAGPSLSYPPALLCHTYRPLCYARRLLSVIPAGPSVMPAGSSLSCP